MHPSIYLTEHETPQDFQLCQDHANTGKKLVKTILIAISLWKMFSKLVKSPFAMYIRKGSIAIGALRRRFCDSAQSWKSAVEDQPSVLKKASQLYVILFTANYISNAMIHPTAKIDYGILNRIFPDNREVNSPFWGTRLPHLFIVPASLTFFDLSIGHLFRTYLGMVSFAATPSLALLHLYTFTWLAVGSFISLDAFANPQHEGHRMDVIAKNIKPLTIGMGLQWHGDLMVQKFGSPSTGLLGLLQTGFAISLVFLPVKALGFGDVGEAGLSPHERKMNDLPVNSSEVEKKD